MIGKIVQRIVGDRAWPWLMIAGIGILGLAVVVGLGACGAGRYPDAQAQRINAETNRIRAESEVNARAASVRQMERDAAHQRALETLPFVVVIVGVTGVVVLVLVIMWDLRRQAAQGPDPHLSVFLERLQLSIDRQNRETWQMIAQISRSLPAGDDRGSVVIYRNERKE